MKKTQSKSEPWPRSDAAGRSTGRHQITPELNPAASLLEEGSRLTKYRKIQQVVFFLKSLTTVP